MTDTPDFQYLRIAPDGRVLEVIPTSVARVTDHVTAADVARGEVVYPGVAPQTFPTGVGPFASAIQSSAAFRSRERDETKEASPKPLASRAVRDGDAPEAPVSRTPSQDML